MAKYVLAVSGGIDSVVLLHLFAQLKHHQLVVAHFDHGIRADSAADARFVEGLAEAYGLPLESRREELGPNASEDMARTRRYQFLFEVARTYGAKLVTAHHQDDVIETITINLVRGTGWRGLAALDSGRVLRPLLAYSKYDIRQYARRHRLEWVEDETNSLDIYLRNRVRFQSFRLTDESRAELIRLWTDQRRLKQAIEAESNRLLSYMPSYSRYFFTQVPTNVAIELLRSVFLRAANTPLTRPQRERALLAIKTARPGKAVELGEGVVIQFTISSFIVTVAP